MSCGERVLRVWYLTLLGRALKPRLLLQILSSRKPSSAYQLKGSSFLFSYILTYRCVYQFSHATVTRPIPSSIHRNYLDSIKKAVSAYLNTMEPYSIRRQSSREQFSNILIQNFPDGAPVYLRSLTTNHNVKSTNLIHTSARPSGFQS